MKYASICLPLAVALSLPEFALAETWSGKIVSFQSGDTLTVKKGKRDVRIHLAGIRAPRKGEAGYRESRRNLAWFCRKRRAVVSAETSGPGVRDGQVACRWEGGSADMSRYQLEQGWARLAPGAVDPELVVAQNRAQGACVGLWHDVCGLAFVIPPFVSPSVPQPPVVAPAVADTGLSATNPAPAPAAANLISYAVTGTATTASVTFATPAEARTLVVTLPFESESFSFPAGQFLFLFARNQANSGTVTVSISLDGEVKKTDTSIVPFGTATTSCTRGSDC